MLGLGLDVNKSTLGNIAITWSNDYSLLLDGVDEYVNIDAVGTALATTTVGTFSFWIKVVDATPTTFTGLLSFGDTNVNSEITVGMQATTGSLRVFARTSGTFDWDLRCNVLPTFTDNVWHHVAIVQDGVSPIMYVDGLAPSQTFNTDTNKTIWFNNITGLDNGRIGCKDNNLAGPAFFVNGNFDEVLFVNRALTSGDITTLYNSGTPKDETAIANGVSQFRFDGDTVPTAVDSIGSNNGTYVNVEQADIELDTP